ncbi:MAG: hypothetical protein N4A49_08880 [Marinifilaceae bacterium]|jgi:hypothetical protein|nr:hypothetical protein [Marinifilaceae bacterium]
MKKIMFFLLASVLVACNTTKPSSDEQEKSNIDKQTVLQTVKLIKEKNKLTDTELLQKGVEQCALLWRKSDGTTQEFKNFCLEKYIKSEKEKELVFSKISRNLEILNGHFNTITIDLLRPTHQSDYDTHEIDNYFGSYSVGAHLIEDFYKNKIAFIVALNFPPFSLEEKEKLAKSWSRKQWAYARLGDMFEARVPVNLVQKAGEVAAATDRYIADYNVCVGYLTDKDNKRFFPEDKVLLSHWNLRDEIKANYANKNDGLEKQKIIYKVMQRIISQEIPKDVINSKEFTWDPYSNKTYKNGKEVNLNSEPNTRYKYLLDNFKANSAMDKYYPNSINYIKRQYDGAKEISAENTEKIFEKFLSSELTKKVGKLIEQRLGRKLLPFDIWYDGFKSRSELDESKLDAQTRKLYPNAKALEADLPNLLLKLGFSKDRAKYICDKIVVDPARGSGHAWGASMKGDVAHLRTRISGKGMDYKGYNIAVHEFGHNVEQTISLYDVDYYMMNGVPNTAFTEALAFIFQKRDLKLLDINTNSPKAEALKTLDLFWSAYEIMGVSLLDIKVWRWMYENPNADEQQLKQATMNLAKEVWNKFYADVYGVKDQTILAIYSHMLNSPLYLSNYAFGNLIEFQLEMQLKDKSFSKEVSRIFKQGRLTPNEWMNQATGNDLSSEPLLKETAKALTKI